MFRTATAPLNRHCRPAAQLSGTRRRLLLQALESRRLLAVNVLLPDAPAYGGSGIVAQFETPVIIEGSSSSSEYTAAFDFDGDGVPDETITGRLPLETTVTPTDFGPREVSLTLNGPDGQEAISGMVDVVPFAVKDSMLRIGGTAANDTALLEVLNDGSLKATVNGASGSFLGAENIAVKLGGGEDTLVVEGSFVLDLAEVSGAVIRDVETLRLDPASAIQVVNLTAETVAAAGGSLTIENAPHHRIAFSAEWQYVETKVVNGIAAHTLRAAEQTLVLRDGVLRNPLLYEDTNLDGAVSPRDALVVINQLNRRSSGDGDVDSTPNNLADVDGDGEVMPLDALLVINRMNRDQRGGLSGEGEREAMVPIVGPLAGSSPSSADDGASWRTAAWWLDVLWL